MLSNRAYIGEAVHKGDRLYRDNVSQTVLKHGAGSCPVGRVPAGDIEAAVIDQLRAVFRQPENVAGTLRAGRTQDEELTEADARAALRQLDPLWDELFPAEQARIVALLVERVDTEYFGFRNGDEMTAEAIADYRLAMREAHGSTMFAGKPILGDPVLEIETMRQLRAALGPRDMIRLDSNMQWSLTTAIRVLREIEPLGSRLIVDQSQNRTVAAMEMADRKTLGHLS